MASREAVETYMSITGASESLAIQKLEEYGGNLNEAVNAHLNGGDIHIVNPPPTAFPQQSVVQPNNENQFARGFGPMLSAARNFRPSLLLDPNYRRNIYSRIGAAGASLLSPPSASTGAAMEPNKRQEELHPMGPFSNLWDGDHTPTGHNTSHPDNHVEDEMVQAAIRASIREAEASSNAGLSKGQFHEEVDDVALAVSQSLKTAEQEEAIREQQLRDNYHQAVEIERRSKAGSSSSQNGAHSYDEQQLRQNSNHGAGNHPEHHEEASHFGEWGGMSSKELDEALMLERVLLGGTPEGASDSALDVTQQRSRLGKLVASDQQPIRLPASSPSSERQLLIEKQDKEYQASLLLDKQKKEESERKMINELRLQRTLAAKKASLPCEPASSDENAVTLLVRMPNGSRAGRRFLKSDRLQLLFDFIDIGGEVKPGTYRLVRSYPRHAFTGNESLLTLTELGLTNKQEALFLEMI